LSERVASPQGAEHDALWNDRLQDWLDGERTPAAGVSDNSSFEHHLANCSSCQAQLADLEQLDAALRSAAPPLALDARFDARLFELMDGQNESARVQARQRLEQERYAGLQALSRRWRQHLAFLIPGVVAGVALALALTGWFGNSALGHHLATEGAQEFGPEAGRYLQLLLTAVLSAGIGFAVASWLSATNE